MDSHEYTFLAEGVNPVRYCTNCGKSNPHWCCNQCIQDWHKDVEEADKKLTSEFWREMIGVMFFLIVVFVVLVAFF